MTVMGAVGIRPAENEDRERVQRLWDDCGFGHIAVDEWDALMAAPTTAVLLAEDGDELAGTAITSFDGWRAYIYHVAVDEKHRRHGIGYDLMAQAEQFLLSAGARYVHVTVHQENTEAWPSSDRSAIFPKARSCSQRGWLRACSGKGRSPHRSVTD